jgi:Domain of unknown function (DUF4388)
MEFSGRLSAFPVGDILQWAANDRRTGALVVRRSRRQKRVYFRSGEVVACLTDEAAESYGQHLLLSGQLSEQNLIAALEHARRQGRRLGAALLELGILTPQTIQESLRCYIEDAVLDLFLWRDGVFFFQAEMPPAEDLLPDPISPVALGLEGARWIDETARMRSILVHDAMVLGPGPGWPGTPLSSLERRITRVIGRGRSLSDLHQEVRGSHFRFLEAIFGLAVRSVLDIKEIGEASDSSSREIRLYDLLLEEEKVAELLRTREHLIVPIEVLAGFHPAWAEPLPAAEMQRLPAVVRDFCAGFDGSRSLRELFSDNPSVLSQQLDGLLLLMRRGRLALLPASAGQLADQAQEKAEVTHGGFWKLFRR